MALKPVKNRPKSIKDYTVNVTLYRQQLEFVTASERFLAFIGGIGSGKSLAGCVRSALAAFGRVGSLEIPTPNLGMITAPTYAMLKDATLRTFLEIAGDLVENYNRSDGIVRLINGSEIIFRSTSEPDRLRGPNASWWYGDEAAMYKPEIWKIMIGRLRQHGRAGMAWVTTTPRGRNWLWQLFEQHKTEEYHKIGVSTWMNPFLDEEFVRGLIREYQGDFAKQELDGEFVAHEGLIYPEFNRDKHERRVDKDARQYVRVVAGVDWGFSNPGVILVGGIDSDGRIHIVHEEYQRRRRIEEWVSAAKQLRNTWNIEGFYCDPSEPDFILAFEQAGLHAYPANNTVNTGIQVVKNRLVIRQDGRPRLTVSPDCVWTMTEFDQYQWASNPNGLQDKPLKTNDHCLDTLRYLVMAVDYADIEPLEISVDKWV